MSLGVGSCPAACREPAATPADGSGIFSFLSGAGHLHVICSPPLLRPAIGSLRASPLGPLDQPEVGPGLLRARWSLPQCTAPASLAGCSRRALAGYRLRPG